MEIMNTNYPSEVINIDEKYNCTNSQKSSVISYAARLFQESTIGMLSSIVTTRSKYRRFFRVFLFLFCISGFLYQSITFLNHVFEYPTSVDIMIDRPDNYNIPAYTFCTNNPIKRSMFCEKYPDRCYEPSEKFCKKFSSYCGTNKTLIPWKRYFELETSMSHEDILKYGDDLEEFFMKNRSQIQNRAVPSGPYLRAKSAFINGAMICYSLHNATENNQKPTKRVVNRDVVKEPDDTLVFYVDESEMFIPGNQPGVLFSIHSSYAAVNPFEKGIFLQPGRTYKIYVQMHEEVLLRQPYETNCKDYEELWERNNYTGPRIQEMCQHKCLMDFFLTIFNCVHPAILYPSDYRICDLKDVLNVTIPLEYAIEKDACIRDCRDDCRLAVYTPDVFERSELDFNENVEDDKVDDYHRYIIVQI